MRNGRKPTAKGEGEGEVNAPVDVAVTNSALATCDHHPARNNSYFAYACTALL
ncbi:uncharacterized protein MYCFIDRAFT_172516 [Pseudocercospora fijiensis CIRAD86]|uniref:Uncharacterized protein n=1 Tax=Pseudocercospora fijiensis (strain CIRAD86) TaxID=383855 RepID=M3AQE6_PSEFD|nr:uncharacterized protein MYCFIDRAFT_172516 [Pseudocercospora fijiensis CIRAD86]EME86826.1 hypothetical protein MYCFIDRAFT_172516 [Pseudocercospora fijiensis CIRAD86]